MSCLSVQKQVKDAIDVTIEGIGLDAKESRLTKKGSDPARRELERIMHA